jgi:hypothetical protein
MTGTAVRRPGAIKGGGMFEIEALKAKHGDCLLLRWGAPQAPRLAVVDGGPDLTYTTALKPRLEALKRNGRISIDLLMLSHIDDDHISGLIDLLEAIEAGDMPVDIDLAWFNHLEGLLDGPLPQGTQAVTAAVHAGFGGRGGGQGQWEDKVLASVPQGQDLLRLLKLRGLDTTLNHPYAQLVMRGLAPKVAQVAGLDLTPIAPGYKAVEALRKVWKEKRKDGVTAAYRDRSPYNLSSIVVVAEYAGKTMLLTGDALGRDVIEGLEAARYPKRDGRWHFDLIKLPHHGSRNNVTQGFFETVTADKYLVSGDQVRFPNPNEDAMHWLAAAREGEDYGIWCTYPLDVMRNLFGNKLTEPSPGALGVRVALD